LDTYDKKSIRWYLSHNIDRWNGKTQIDEEKVNTIAAQNESYFASLFEKFEKSPIISAKSDITQASQVTEENSSSDSE
jgi:hypothetical protein